MDIQCKVTNQALFDFIDSKAKELGIDSSLTGYKCTTFPFVCFNNDSVCGHVNSPTHKEVSIDEFINALENYDIITINGVPLKFTDNGLYYNNNFVPKEDVKTLYKAIQKKHIVAECGSIQCHITNKSVKEFVEEVARKNKLLTNVFPEYDWPSFYLSNGTFGGNYHEKETHKTVSINEFIDAIENFTKVEICGNTVTFLEGKVRIGCNNGPTITHEEIKKVYDRFYSE